MKTLSYSISMLILLGSISKAQVAKTNPSLTDGGHVGGGEITETDLQTLLNSIDSFIETPDGKKAFPEVVQFDAQMSGEAGRTQYPDLSPVTFHQLMTHIHPVLKAEEVRDSFGVVRTCVSHPDLNARYFQCDSRKLPKYNDDNYRRVAVLMLHEVFFQAGIEKAISEDIPSEYFASSRIKDLMHRELKDEWQFSFDHPGINDGAIKLMAQGTILRSKTTGEKLFLVSGKARGLGQQQQRCENDPLLLEERIKSDSLAFGLVSGNQKTYNVFSEFDDIAEYETIVMKLGHEKILKDLIKKYFNITEEFYQAVLTLTHQLISGKPGSIINISDQGLQVAKFLSQLEAEGKDMGLDDLKERLGMSEED